MSEEKRVKAAQSYLSLEGIRAWLPIILVVASLIGGWAYMGNQITTEQKDEARLRLEFDTHMADVSDQKTTRDIQYAAIEAQLAQLQTDVSWLKLRLGQSTMATP